MIKDKHSDSLRYVYDIIKEGVWDWNANTGRVDRSPGWYRMLGYEVDCLKKDVFTWENIIHPDDYPQVMAIFDAYITGNRDTYEAEYRCKKANGDYLWVIDQGKIVERNPDNSIARMIGAHTDIHTQKLAQEELRRQNETLTQSNFNLENTVRMRTLELEEINKLLQKQVNQSSQDANTDSLTNLYNRRKFEIELQKEVARAKRYNSPLSLALFDADHFKLINDTLGHAAGDKALQIIASEISGNIRENDIASRWGGEEFTVIFPGTTRKGAHATAEKIRASIEGSVTSIDATITCSVGIAEFDFTESLETLLKRLDQALYEAKDSGRNCIR